MRSQIPIILASAAAFAGVALVLKNGEPSGHGKSVSDVSVQTAVEGTAPIPAPESNLRTLSRATIDPFERIEEEEVTSFDRDSLLLLFQAGPGTAVTLPFGEGLTGRVTMTHSLPQGLLSIGVKLDEFDNASAYLTLNQEGKIGGHLSSRNSGSAWRIERSEKDGQEVLKRISADALICARYERGNLLPGMPPEPEASENSADSGPGGYASAPLLESRPGSPRVIYLNFDGETVSGTPWNSSYNAGSPIEAAPFSNPSLIPDIWASIAEDYAVYEVNVTTDRAAFENAAPQHRVMAIFTPTKSWYGSAGGVAYVDSFGDPTNPFCWVFNVTLSGAAESGSHEIGHALGLRHDGTSSRVYYTGHTHSSGVSWAPIMGTGYNRTVVQFSKGEYPSASRTEDDFQIMSGYLSFLPDDHANSPIAATPLSSDGIFNLNGIIENANDSDWFRFQSAATGPLSVHVSPPAQFRNLDTGIELLDEALDVVASSAPEGPFDASIELPSLPPGIYYLRVHGTGLGDLANGYGNYGSVGNYTLGGTFTAAPPPETPTGLSATDGSSTDGVTVSWNVVTPADSYHVYRGLLEDGSDAALIASPAVPSHFDESSIAGIIYHYFVTAVHLGRESTRSPGETGWRQRLPPASPAPVQTTDDSPHSIRVSWTAAERAQSYRIWRNASDTFPGSTEVANTSLLSWHDTTTAPGEAWYYFVESVNTGGTSAPAGSPTAGVRIALPSGTPTELSASDGTSSLLTLLTWSAGDGATGYRIYRNSIESSGGATEIAQVGNVTSYEDGTGSAGEIYWYFVRAILSGGDSIPSNLDEGSRQIHPPSPPVGVTASMGSHPDGVLVSWTVTPDTDTYYVYRGIDGNPMTAELLGETGSNSWLDEEAAPGRTYRYFIKAANSAGTSDFTSASLGFGPESDPLDDLYENNDDLSVPTVLDPGAIEAVAVDGDPDWFEVTLAPGDSRLDLLVPYDVDRGSILVSLHETSGAPVASHLDAPGAKVLSYTGGDGGTYRILVERDDGAAVPYHLEWRSLSEDDSGLVPDVTLGLRFPPSLGKEIINGKGAGQSILLKLRSGDLRRVYGEAVNFSAVPGSFAIRGSGNRKPFQLEYDILQSGIWKRVTAAMRRNGLVRDLDPLSAATFRISASRGKGRSKRHSRLLRCLSAKPQFESYPVDTSVLRLVDRAKRR
ncbi:MAG: hypothetical protein KDN18_08570 [Verrucomicrobiae bacterium]|nr:hypothetical protein [Verrucomicrobiae bacterium]